MQSRRDFLRLLGLTAGATILGCGSGEDMGTFSGFSPTSAPNAYQFTPLVSSGTLLPNRSSIRAQVSPDGGPPFIGAVVVNDLRHICFHANDADGKMGVYRIDYDRSGETTEIQSLLVEGQRLSDGTVVDIISPRGPEHWRPDVQLRLS